MQGTGERVAAVAAFLVAAAWGAAALVTLPMGELYPSPSLPSFAGSPLRSGVVTVTRPVVEATFVDGSTASIPYLDLMPRDSPSPVNVFRTFAYDAATATAPETVTWFVDRIEALHPGHEVATVTVEWVRYRYSSGPRDRLEAEVQRTLVIEADDS